jgi:hypothetical protein
MYALCSDVLLVISGSADAWRCDLCGWYNRGRVLRIPYRELFSGLRHRDCDSVTSKRDIHEARADHWDCPSRLQSCRSATATPALHRGAPSLPPKIRRQPRLRRASLPSDYKQLIVATMHFQSSDKLLVVFRVASWQKLGGLHGRRCGVAVGWSSGPWRSGPGAHGR